MIAADETGQQPPARGATTRQEDGVPPEAGEPTPGSAVDALIADALKAMGTPDLSIRKLEAQNGMPEGSLSTPLKKANRGKWPTLQTLQRFAQALKLDIHPVSRAFSADAIGDALTDRQRRCLAMLAQLPESYQDTALEQVGALLELARRTGNLVIDNQSVTD
ncbi:hypothetical protein [Lentzea sp. NBRC 102530]|uniref:hypothetical protein n=1 Tax=Lentzea sp. NBRC 102530 TaxID=3032201 RepID=UPI00255576EF|nr:hypothetical protein [Lentzea sp. NBRC 102530]